MTFDDSTLAARQLASQRGFYDALSSGSAGARMVGFGETVSATVVPMQRAKSLFNAVVYEDGDELIAAIPELARLYDDAGILAWTVWVRPGHEAVARALEAEGHKLDATPQLMAAPLEEIDLDGGDAELEIDRAVSWRDIAVCNDLAYGVPPKFTLGSGLTDLDTESSHLYAVRRDGEVASCLVTRDADGDCGVYFVATTPEARGAGLARELLRAALRDGRERGCQTTSLEATRAGRPSYERLGYRSLGVIEMWERRKAPDADSSANGAS